MNKEEIIKELDKQNKQLGVELSLTKDKLNKTLFILDKIKEKCLSIKGNPEHTIVSKNELVKQFLELLEEIE